MPELHTIALAHGALRYRTSGPPDGRPVLLVHGAGVHGGWWAEVARRLPPDWRLVVPDLRGHGASAWGDPAGYRLEDFTADLTALLDVAAAGPVAVIGHSMGGRVALWLAAHHPARVRALGLIDTRVAGLQPARVDEWRGIRAGAGARRADPTREAAMARFRIVPDEPGLDPACLSALAAEAVGERVPGEWTLRFDRAILDLGGSRIADLAPLLPRIGCPTLVVRGADSAVAGERATAAVVAALPDARAAVLPGRHHFALAQPDATARLLIDFLDGPGAG